MLNNQGLGKSILANPEGLRQLACTDLQRHSRVLALSKPAREPPNPDRFCQSSPGLPLDLAYFRMFAKSWLPSQRGSIVPDWMHGKQSLSSNGAAWSLATWAANGGPVFSRHCPAVMGGEAVKMVSRLEKPQCNFVIFENPSTCFRVQVVPD